MGNELKPDAERAAWLADKIVALGDYAKEAAELLRRWPSASDPVGEPVAWVDGAALRWLSDPERDPDAHIETTLNKQNNGVRTALYASPLPQEPVDAAMLWLARVRDDFRRMADDANATLAGRVAEIASLPQEPREAEQVCAEAYQVVGSLLSDLGKFDTPEAEKILDNLSQAKLVHKDVLPWPSYASGAQEVKAK